MITIIFNNFILYIKLKSISLCIKLIKCNSNRFLSYFLFFVAKLLIIKYHEIHEIHIFINEFHEMKT